jgi:ATP-binding cassette, subfamily B (MDR/TAP), member 1
VMNKGGEFRAMADTQGQSGFPEKQDRQSMEAKTEQDIVDALLDQVDDDLEEITKAGWASRHQSIGGLTLRPLTGTWMFDVIADMVRGTSQEHGSSLPVSVSPQKDQHPLQRTTLLRWSSNFASSPVSTRPIALTHMNRRSFALSPLPSAFPYKQMPPERGLAPSIKTGSSNVEDDDEFELDKSAINSSGIEASKRRLQASRRRHSRPANSAMQIVQDPIVESDPDKRPLSVVRVLRNIYPSIPNKPLVAFGLVTCLLSGSVTPIFSFTLSRLFFEVSAGAKDVGVITRFALITFAVAAADGFFAGLKSILMENAAVRWITRVRKTAFALVLAQDKAWFDNPVNNPARLVDVLVRDAEDAKRLLSICLGMFVVVSTMLLVGLVWAMVWGWQLTLVGVALVLIFAGSVTLQTRLTSKFQSRNRRAREQVSRVYYEVSCWNPSVLYSIFSLYYLGHHKYA